MYTDGFENVVLPLFFFFLLKKKSICTRKYVSPNEHCFRKHLHSHNVFENISVHRNTIFGNISARNCLHVSINLNNAQFQKLQIKNSQISQKKKKCSRDFGDDSTKQFFAKFKQTNSIVFKPCFGSNRPHPRPLTRSVLEICRHV